MLHLLHIIDIFGLGRHDGGCRFENRKLKMLVVIIKEPRLWEGQVCWQLPADGWSTKG